MTRRMIHTIDDLRALHGAPEDRTMELKRQPIDTARLAEIVQAGANGSAPVFHIIIGADESRGVFDFPKLQPLVFPLQVAAKGRSIESFDAYKRHLIDVISAHTDGYFEGFFDVREIAFERGSIIVIEVPQSRYRPHQNIQSKKYFIKADGKIRPMDDLELEDAIASRRDRRIAVDAHGHTATLLRDADFVDIEGDGQIVAVSAPQDSLPPPGVQDYGSWDSNDVRSRHAKCEFDTTTDILRTFRSQFWGSKCEDTDI